MQDPRGSCFFYLYTMLLTIAAGLGIEPKFSLSESDVLPLDDPAIFRTVHIKYPKTRVYSSFDKVGNSSSVRAVMDNHVNIHPDTKHCMLGWYLIIVTYADGIIVNEAKLARVSEKELRSQTRHWPLLRELLLFCRARVLKGEHFERIIIPDLGSKSPEEIVDAIIES